MAITITYTQQGDYLLPDLKLPEQPKVEIDVFGQRCIFRRVSTTCTEF